MTELGPKTSCSNEPPLKGDLAQLCKFILHIKRIGGPEYPRQTTFPIWPKKPL